MNITLIIELFKYGSKLAALMLNEYPQEFITLILKTSRSCHYSSETRYQDTVFIPYDKVISEKFKHTGTQFNVKIVFKTKQIVLGTL
jgi:hypothetical protein